MYKDPLYSSLILLRGISSVHVCKGNTKYCCWKFQQCDIVPRNVNCLIWRRLLAAPGCFKVTRLLLSALLLMCVAEMGEATLNMIGMTSPAERGPMQLTLGKRAKRNSDDDDDDEDDPPPTKDPGDGACLDVKPSAWTLSNMYRDQPLFMNFRPRTEEAMLIDNICYTFFPLPDDQFTYVMYISTVYQDGSNLIESSITTDVQLGIFRASSPYCTFKDYVLGYAGCDTFVMYRCYLNSECRSKVDLFTFGLSQSCKQISISCLQKIEDIIEGNGISEQDYVALPMRLPSECVFEPICSFKGEVYNQVGIHQGELVNPVKEVVIFEEPAPVLVEEVIHQPVLVEEVYLPPVVEEVFIPPPPPRPVFVEERLIPTEPVSTFYTFEGFSPANKYRPQPRPGAPPRPPPFYPKQGPRKPFGYYR